MGGTTERRGPRRTAPMRRPGTGGTRHTCCATGDPIEKPTGMNGAVLRQEPWGSDARVMPALIDDHRTPETAKRVDHPVRIGKARCRYAAHRAEWLGDRTRPAAGRYRLRDWDDSTTFGTWVMLIAHSAAQPEWTATRFSSTQYPKGPRTFLRPAPEATAWGLCVRAILPIPAPQRDTSRQPDALAIPGDAGEGVCCSVEPDAPADAAGQDHS
jgi:hypothetical protein